MRIQGKSTAQIAKQLGMTDRNVRYLLSQAVTAIDATEYLQEMTEVTIRRLDAMLTVAWERAMGTGKFDGADPDLDWFRACLKIIERQSKMLGLDAPKRVDVVHIVEQWARNNGYDPQDVVDVVATLIPTPQASAG